MDFAVYSEEKIENADFTLPHIIISISDVPEYPATLPENPLCRGILRLSFYDAVPGEFPEHLMKAEQARQIWDFTDSYRDKVGLIVVQCVYGESRSAAVAAALSQLLNGHTGDFFSNERYSPNRYVYNLMLATL